MRPFVFRHAARSLAKLALALFIIVAVWAALVHPLELPRARPPDQASGVTATPAPSPAAGTDATPGPVAGHVEPVATPGPLPPSTAAPAAVTATKAPVTSVPSTLERPSLPYLPQDALGQWQRRLAAVRDRVPGAQATLALVGDSWVDGDVILGSPLRQALQAKYGDGGAGFVEFGGGGDYAKGPPFATNITYERSGAWTVHDAFTDPAGRGVDLADVSSTDASTPGAITLTGAFAEAILHYIKQPGGGSFRWRVDSGPWQEVSTATQRPALAIERIAGLSLGHHVVKIEVASAGTSGVWLTGADLRKPGSGVRVDRVGMNGATALDYTEANAALWQAGLAALEPDLVILLLGTNDQARQRLPEQFRADMDALVDRVRAATPQAGILLLAPGDNNLKATGQAPLAIDEYTDELRALAEERGLAFLDSSQVLGSFPEANARGLYYDDVHINETGGRVLAGYLLENLLDPRVIVSR
jgi:lysophospholipase L1-like esterase